jgi:hypothetical protein
MKRSLRLAMALCFLLQGGSASALTLETLPADGSWHAFDVDDLTSLSGGLEWITLADGDELGFHIELAEEALFTVVDAGFAGDLFEVLDNGVLLGETSAAIDSYPASVVTDFDAALADPDYSRGSWLLAPGVHDITGRLSRSALAEGLPINATVGAVRLGIVPEPTTAVLVLLGLANLAAASRRRSA